MTETIIGRILFNSQLNFRLPESLLPRIRWLERKNKVKMKMSKLWLVVKSNYGGNQEKDTHS
jgi:hypothetical protein